MEEKLLTWSSYDGHNGFRGCFKGLPLFNIFYRKGNLFETSFYELDYNGGWFKPVSSSWLDHGNFPEIKGNLEYVKEEAEKLVREGYNWKA